ncbi:MAG: ATP-dependent RNA helicase HrpA [Gammaproteobacteria bacterium]|nr:ATP-dependent RNA helicase HrpA [Gammaproteobacteria bacterium]
MNAANLIRDTRSRLGEIMSADAAWCRKRLSGISRQLGQGKQVDKALQQVVSRFTQSRNRVKQRARSAPAPGYAPDLPITAHREEILEAIAAHQVVIVAGETGSGKTTQLPKMCLEAARGVRGLIGCTQPRRIAARAMADRVAEELGVELGSVVGYQVRFRERTSPDGYVKFMTDGILLAEALGDRFLDAYDTIIIDEAHERSLNIDFLLGYLKTLLPKRPDLKLIVTSATIDTRKFSNHFSDAPVIEVSGRGYPVDIVYQPLANDGEGDDRGGRDLYQGIADAVRRLNRTDPRGDILVFLSGEREIREAADFLGRAGGARGGRNTDILPLYSRLSSAEQRRVFHPGEKRRIILSTNVAETSLTVPRIRFVIDSGLARISRYGHRSRIQRLPIEPVSQASARQRAGRCGRLGPGTCVRLYSEEDFENRPEFTEPEILRTSLASVILRMLTMNLGSVEDFPFVDKPAPRMINDAYQLLFELGGLDRERGVTDTGRRLARWPMDVRLARIVEEGAAEGCLEDMMVLAAALSIQDPRERPLEAQSAADEAHGRFADPKSDFVTLLKLWQYLRKLRKSISGNQFRKRCRREFLNWQRVLEWFDLYQQLRSQAREDRLKLSGRHGGYDAVHRCLLTGLLSHVGLKHPEDNSYSGVRSRSFYIFPGSGLFGAKPKWLMAAEIVETTRPYARINAVIRPEWVEDKGAHLLKRHYFDPHWSRKRGAVMAWEQVTMYGLVIVEKRRVRYQDIDREESRRIFITEALVRGELDTRAAFREHNERIRAEVEAMEAKRRKRDVLADERVLFDFFDARVPEEVTGAKRFERWLSGLRQSDRELLYLGHDVLMRDDAGGAPQELFPDELQVRGRLFALSYHFEPGADDDGVTLTVPLELLNTLDAGRLQWLVPGLLRDKLTALIRQLPKPMRRSLTPAPNFADALAEVLREHGGQPMLEALSAEIHRMTGLEVPMSELDERRIDPHFRFLLRVENREGECLARSRDLDELQEQLGRKAQRRFMDRQGAAYNRDGETDWAFTTLEARVTTGSGAVAFPALVDQEKGVGLRLFDTWEEAAHAHSEGVIRLLRFRLADKLKYLASHHGLDRRAQMSWSSVDSPARLAASLVLRSLEDAAGEVTGVRDEAAFDALCDRVRTSIGKIANDYAALLNEALGLYGELAPRVSRLARTRPDVHHDTSTQLDDMLYAGFLQDLFPGRLQHYPRYLRALRERLDQLELDPAKDAARQALISPWWARYLEALEAGQLYDQAMDSYRWLVEEYRVSVFAQKLGTAEKVSDKRLSAAWRATGS